MSTDNGPPAAAEDLLYEVADGIGLLTFNRARARNALTYAMYERLSEICRSIGQDRSVKALILQGAGGEAFASGTDIAQFRAFSEPSDALAYEARIERVLTDLERCRVPTIAAVAGACTGGGCAIAACCDLRVAAPNARFGFPMARTLGNCLSVANIARLVSILGAPRVTEMLFTARLVDAAEAKAIGLVTELAPAPDKLLERARALATLVAGHAPLTLRATKEAIRRLRVPPAEADDIVLTCYESRDFREGIEAFLAKRRPEWRGE
jgi:enoyl-CoA hydratase/carnithine racemase